MSIDATSLQARLKSAGHDPGPIDGAWGPRTWAALLSYVAGRALGDRGMELGRALTSHAAAYGIITPLRLAHLLAQLAHESGGFQYLREIWGPTDAQRRYEGRAALGNTEPGDGRRYMGRGLIQVTGRANYRTAGQRLGIDLEGTPYLAEEPHNAVLTALDYWKSRGLNALADRDDIAGITRKINGGLTGYADRKRCLVRAKQMLT